MEYRLRTKSGDYRWIYARGQTVWDESGQPTRMAGSITDITERKQMKAQLIVPISDQLGQIVQFVAIRNDITDHKQARRRCGSLMMSQSRRCDRAPKN